MKILIAYASSHGTTEKAAKLLNECLEGDVELLNLRKSLSVDLELYDAVVIGGSIHAGGMQGKVKHFIKKYHDSLLTKKIGLYLCCMFEGDKAKEQFDTAFPKDIRDVAVATGLFGGEFIFAKMNFLERMIVKKVSGVTSDASTFDTALVKDFAYRFTNK